MKIRKRTFWSFREYEGGAFSGYLEEMAAGGWHLKACMQGGGLLFKRGEPCALRYNAVLMPGETEFDEEESENKERFRELCTQAGWRFVCGSAAWQIFCTDDGDALPIETDPGLRLTMVREWAFSRWNLLRIILSAALLLSALGRVIVLTAGGANAAAGIGRMIPIGLSLIYILSHITGSWFWCRRSEAALASGEPLPESGMEEIKKRTVFSTVLLLVIGFSALGYGKVFDCLFSVYLFYCVYGDTVSCWMTERRTRADDRIWSRIRVGIVLAAAIFFLLCAVINLFRITV